MSCVRGDICQWGSTLKVGIELPVTSRHRRDMIEILLKVALSLYKIKRKQNKALELSGWNLSYGLKFNVIPALARVVYYVVLLKFCDDRTSGSIGRLSLSVGGGCVCVCVWGGGGVVLTGILNYLILHLISCNLTNNAYPDRTQRFVASDPGLNYLPMSNH